MKNKFILSSLLIFFAFVLIGCEEQKNNEIYSIGTEIAEGVGTSLAVGFSSMDSSLTYEIKTSNDEFTSQGNTWPIIDVSVIVKSEVLGSPKITFVLLLEIDYSSGTIVGTVKNIKADGLTDPSLEVMNNTMYIETDEGTEQVQIIEGELRFIEQAEITTALEADTVNKDFYIIATDIASSENEASEKVNKLKSAGYDSDYLWIPDYKSLSGAEYFSVFIGPFSSIDDCASSVQEYRKDNPSAYGLLVSNESSKRVEIRGPDKIKITEGSNIKKSNIQAKDKIITFNEATDFMRERCKNIDQTLMKTHKVEIDDGRFLYVFLSYNNGINGILCVSVINDISLELLASDCGPAETKMQEWEELLYSTNL